VADARYQIRGTYHDVRAMARLRARTLQREGRLTLDLDGRAIPLMVRRNPRARRLTLTIDSENDGAIVTNPSRVPLEEALDKARSRASWILSRLEALPPRVPFVDGACVPYLGTTALIRHDPIGRRPVYFDDGNIYVSGRPEHLARRVRDWYKAEARRHISGLAAEKSTLIERTVTRITLRDPRSRWGSCTTDGRLSFSWRLMMMPEWVLDYIVAHEVAHLVAMNHGPRFWRTVDKLTADHRRANAWLKSQGNDVHRYG